ncbi:MAG: GAF domain-containing protein, partial [Microvirga sp.]
MTLQTPQDIDLTACEREPIHIPGSIQPHGILLAIRLSDRTIAYASANIAETFGFDPADALGRPFEQVLPALSAEFAAQLDDPPSAGSTRFVRTIQVRTAREEKFFETAISRSGDCAILELEEPPSDTVSSIDAHNSTLRRFVGQLQEASTVEFLFDLAAQDIRRMTGFDRVLIYRFDDAWNGTVIAEDRNEVLPSYLDLRFPASDIPAQARELYRRNRLRIIPDANYAPVPIQSRDPAPLDLSDSVLRSVSPVHLEYMRNMGTLASMSISILRDGELWGLISCH